MRYPMLVLLLLLIPSCVSIETKSVSRTPVTLAAVPTIHNVPLKSTLDAGSENMIVTETPTLEGTAAIMVATPATATDESVSASCSSLGWMENVSVSTASTGRTLRFRAYMPPCYGADGFVYPVLYMLHGSVQDDSHWDQLGLDEAAESGIISGRLPSMIIIMPDGGMLANQTSGGPGSYEILIVEELIPLIDETYCTWSEGNGRAIGGLSRGGYWALEIAFRHPEQFISVGGHSAALLDIAAGPDLNPQYTALSRDLGQLRIYLDIGRDDWVIPNTARLHEDLVLEGIEHTWRLNPGVHEDSYWTEHLAEYLEWYAEPWQVNRATLPLCN